jgi:hypothetical protein
MVMGDGFAWNGHTYDSLSKVAFAITGTKWNGPRFFGRGSAAVTVDRSEVAPAYRRAAHGGGRYKSPRVEQFLAVFDIYFSRHEQFRSLRFACQRACWRDHRAGVDVVQREKSNFLMTMFSHLISLKGSYHAKSHYYFYERCPDNRYCCANEFCNRS